MKTRLLILTLILLMVQSTLADEGDPFRIAVTHLQKGRYAEALETLDQLAEQKADPARLAIERSRVQEALGQWKELTQQLEATVKTQAKNADLLARLAEVYFRQGQYNNAQKTINEVLKLDGQHPKAHLVLADLQTETGQLEKALENYVWFVRFYNRAQPKDAETLALVAKGSLQYARWKGSSQILKFVVNTLCPDMLKDDEDAWQSHQIAGDLLLEKYNRAQALPELNRALAINPRAADVLVSLGNAAYQNHDLDEATKYANQALEINPNHIPALWLKTDLFIAAGQFSQAENQLQTALTVNPHEQRTLARFAALLILRDNPLSMEQLKELLTHIDAIDKFKPKNSDAVTKLVVGLAKRNPHPGYFLSILAEALESRRKYDLAELFYEQAIQSMPQLSTPKTALGMLYMRTGKTDEATKLLDDAFAADPFHVRVSNMRKVLKVLNGYETISTDHFVIRVDSELDKVLGQYMADYLESIYPELTQQFDYEPPHRTHFEIYNKAKGLSAHQWFSARMIGLPWVQTIGASTGVIVALASPTAAEEPFNWARVLKHEFVHVLTLQQTKFNIPHWFTEALAVTAEGSARPEIWNDLLLTRVPKGEIHSLDELNDEFIRPKSPDDWQFAYCQSRLYAQYMIETYGQKTIPKMLECYRNNMATKQAIPKVFGVDVETFEKGYRDFLNKIVKEIQGGVTETEEKTLAEWEKAYQAKPDDAKTAGKFAEALLKNRQWDKAKEVADKAIANDKTEPNAAIVLATLEIRERNTGKAVEYLEDALTEPLHPDVLELLARLRIAQKKYGEAQELYRKGHQAFPYASVWLKGLAVVALRMDDKPALKSVLIKLVERGVENPAYPKKLAEIALEEKDYKTAIKYGIQTIHIDVMDAEIHRILGGAYEGLNDYQKAIQEYRVALELAPKTAEAELGLARSFIHEKQTDAAKRVLMELLKRESSQHEAQDLLNQLKN